MTSKLTIVDLRDLLAKVEFAEEEIHKKKNIASVESIANELYDKIHFDLRLDNITDVKEIVKKKIEELKNSPAYWDLDIYKKNAESNMLLVKNTIEDIEFHQTKVMICGRAVDTHPNFFPRFSTPTVGIDSTIFITVDHDPAYAQFITRKGNYALGIIVDPKIPKKILEMGGTIYWFSPDFLDSELVSFSIGKIPRGNSGLAAINLASFLGADLILLSGIKLQGQYDQFREGQKLVFEQAQERGTRIFSLDGELADKLTFDKWCEL